MGRDKGGDTGPALYSTCEQHTNISKDHTQHSGTPWPIRAQSTATYTYSGQLYMLFMVKHCVFISDAD